MTTKRPRQPKQGAQPVRDSVRKVLPLDVPTFVKATRVAVLKVDLFDPRGDQVLAYFKGRAGVGWVDWTQIDHDTLAARWWIDAQHHHLGWGADQLVRMGYYVFVDGDVCGYHLGEIDFKRDGISLTLGLASIALGLISDNDRWFGAAAHAAQVQAAARVNVFFEERIARAVASQPRSAPPPPPPVPPGDVTAAFHALGLPPSANHAEVKAKYRSLAREHHSDFVVDDAKKKEADHRMAELNAAYSIICSIRRW